MELYVGCAGWSIRKEHAEHFPQSGSHLERYAARFSAVEITSSFYRPHRLSTYTRWAAAVPDRFRFTVKSPRTATHVHRLDDPALLDGFLGEVAALGDKLGPILVQLPPSLAFHEPAAAFFFAGLRARFDGAVACEPRHASWFTGAGDRLLRDFEVARVAADPAVVPAAAEPGGWEGFFYYRQHGSPKKYYSAYEPTYLEDLAEQLAERAGHAPTWCFFDNTAAGAATVDALLIQDLLSRAGD